jgi:hypothetical protein
MGQESRLKRDGGLNGWLMGMGGKQRWLPTRDGWLRVTSGECVGYREVLMGCEGEMVNQLISPWLPNLNNVFSESKE